MVPILLIILLPCILKVILVFLHPRTGDLLASGDSESIDLLSLSDDDTLLEFERERQQINAESGPRFRLPKRFLLIIRSHPENRSRAGNPE